jgi:hypothetical protein
MRVNERVSRDSYSAQILYEPASSSQLDSSWIWASYYRAKSQTSYERVTSYEFFAQL